MHVVGTAGHVDHGKSSLVRALTGTDPDRWIEERLRGMTLDLGFAHLRYDDGIEAGIVDVPGHERFLHNMLAGAAGMELLLLVVAANEGVRPQTLEHLAIAGFLNVRRAIIVLSKCDLVDATDRARAEAAVRAAIAGTVAHDAPAVAVSSLTGEGIEELRAAIHAALVALPPRPAEAPAFLPVDRVFALPGRGTIVTGTLMQGTLRTGDTLRLDPPGPRRARAFAAGLRRHARDGRRRRARRGERPRDRRRRSRPRRGARRRRVRPRRVDARALSRARPGDGCGADRRRAAAAPDAGARVSRCGGDHRNARLQRRAAGRRRPGRARCSTCGAR